METQLTVKPGGSQMASFWCHKQAENLLDLYGSGMFLWKGPTSG